MNAQELKTELDQKRDEIRKAHDAGLDGLSVCARLSSVVDKTIIDLLANEKFDGAVVALGGYGRGLLNPFSDVDILFLLRNANGDDDSDTPNTMIAGLWDMGLKVGHSSRTIEDTVVMGLSDTTARTSMIECRLLSGDKALYDKFQKIYSRKVIRNKPDNFIHQKIAEMRGRHASHGRVSLLTEPNLKESMGGLRDFQTAWWALRSKMDVSHFSQLAFMGIMKEADIPAVREAHSFVLRLRNALHFYSGKPQETLAQAVQPEIARREGFSSDSDNEVSAELMKKYFRSAKVIERFAEEMTDAALEYRRKRFWRPMNIDKDGLFGDGAKLRAKGFLSNGFDDSPSIMFRVARRLAEEDLKPAPNLWRGLEKIGKLAPQSWFEGEEAGRCLLGVLKLKNCSEVLSIFRDTGILQRFIPEFNDIDGLSQFDMFHRYSVDEHTIHTIRKFEFIPKSKHVNPLMKEVLRGQRDTDVIKLALILHDLGKRAEDHHAVEEDTRTEAIVNRLGLPHLAKTILFLVEGHLLMSVTAQRRDFTVPETLKHFCDDVGGRENLRRLYLLTYADIAGVGPGIWSDWKDKLLWELFDWAEKYFIEGSAVFISSEKQIEALSKEIGQVSCGITSAKEALGFLLKAPDRYVRSARPESSARDIRLVAKLKKERIALGFKLNRGDLTGEITLAGRDRHGFFSVISGTLAAKNISIAEAQIYTLKGGVALDTIVVEGKNLSLFSDDLSLERFRKELLELLDGDKDVNEMVRRRVRYMSDKESAPSQTDPRVAILNHLSNDGSVIETRANDRVGLLYDITRALASLNLDIISAKIGSEGPRTINSFYVAGKEGGKIEGKEKITAVKEAIISAIGSPAGVE